MRICSDQPCIVLLTEKDVWIRVNGKEPISLKAKEGAN
ncbi:AraC family transcriptional regulator, partial [Escherichia coli]|nr:AraC family transcriptional regulator [Escherichia coli]